MLTALVISLFGFDMTQTLSYQNFYTPKVRKEIVIEVDEPAPIEVVAPPKEKYNVNCFCVSFVRQFIPELPRKNAKDFIPNTTMKNGSVVILDYNGLRHIALYEITQEGLLVREANYKPCKSGERLIKWNELDKTLVGFYIETLLDNQNNNMTEENTNEAVEENKDEEVETPVEETPEVETPEAEATDEDKE